MSARYKLLIAGLGMVAMILVGAAGYMVIEDEITFGEAAYMTIISVSTVGFGEEWPMSPEGKVWTVLVICVGILSVSLAFASLQAIIVGGELKHLMGRKKLQDRIGKLSGHFIVCGFGRMGTLIVKELESIGKKVVVIDIDEKRTSTAGDHGYNYVLGDASEEEALSEAHIERAGGLVSVLRNDADNVIVTLTARAMEPDLKIIARAENLASQPKLMRAGATRVVCPQAIGAIRAVNALARPGISSVVDLTMGNADYEIDEIIIPQESPLADRTLREVDLRSKADLMVLAIRSKAGGTELNPGPDSKLIAGDTLVVIGPSGISSTLSDMLAAE